jgi:hypothetical protein
MRGWAFWGILARTSAAVTAGRLTSYAPGPGLRPALALRAFMRASSRAARLAARRRGQSEGTCEQRDGTSTCVCGKSGQSVRVRARRAAIPRICEWPPSIIHPPLPTSMLVCSRHRTTVAAHILDAVSAWPPRARPPLAACPSSSARNRLCKSVWRATAELSGGCPPGEAWMEPALNCIETGMATACAERGSEQRAECESDIRCNERRRHPAAYEAWPLSAWQGARRRSPASRSHRRRSGEEEGPTAGRNRQSPASSLGFRMFVSELFFGARCGAILVSKKLVSIDKSSQVKSSPPSLLKCGR